MLKRLLSPHYDSDCGAGMESQQDCPLCGSYDVRTIVRADDGLTAYRCHDCQHVFHSSQISGIERREQAVNAPPRRKTVAEPQ